MNLNIAQETNLSAAFVLVAGVGSSIIVIVVVIVEGAAPEVVGGMTTTETCTDTCCVAVATDCVIWGGSVTGDGLGAGVVIAGGL